MKEVLKFCWVWLRHKKYDVDIRIVPAWWLVLALVFLISFWILVYWTGFHDGQIAALASAYDVCRRVS